MVDINNNTLEIEDKLYKTIDDLRNNVEELQTREKRLKLDNKWYINENEGLQSKICYLYENIEGLEAYIWKLEEKKYKLPTILEENECVFCFSQEKDKLLEKENRLGKKLSKLEFELFLAEKQKNEQKEEIVFQQKKIKEQVGVVFFLVFSLVVVFFLFLFKVFV